MECNRNCKTFCKRFDSWANQMVSLWLQLTVLLSRQSLRISIRVLPVQMRTCISWALCNSSASACCAVHGMALHSIASCMGQRAASHPAWYATYNKFLFGNCQLTSFANWNWITDWLHHCHCSTRNTRSAKLLPAQLTSCIRQFQTNCAQSSESTNSLSRAPTFFEKLYQMLISQHNGITTKQQAVWS